MTRKPAGTASLLPVKGSGCGIRPDLDAMSTDVAFDFSGAADFLPENQKDTSKKTANSIDTKKVRK